MTVSGGRQPPSRHALARRILIGAAWTTILACPGFAQTVPAESDLALEAIDPAKIAPDLLGTTAGRASEGLDAIAGQLRLTEDRITEIRSEITALDGDATQLGAELIAAGQRVDLAAADVRIIEERLEELFASERSLRHRLDGHDRSISNLLASLQRISVAPPPALIVDPSDALGSARAALLLSAVLPQLQEKAATVTEDLAALATLRQTASNEADQLAANLTTLNEERLRIATIIEARKQGMEWLSEELILEEAEAQALADRATSLEQLIAGLEARLSALNAAGAATRVAQAGQALPTLDPQTVAIAFADTTRTQPAVPIEAARGYLTLPVSGTPVATYGASDGLGGTARGLSLATSPAADVLAPADGWVVYTGPFLTYGQIVILNAGQDYVIVMTGMAEVFVERGAFIMMGTPIGVMGDSSAHVTSIAGVSEPTLYIELRENGIPIDPNGWWAARPEPEESGSS